MKIFDEDGNEVAVSTVIYDYLETKSIKHNKDIEDLYISYDDSHWNKNRAPSIYILELVDGGYDCKHLQSLDDEDMVI